MINLPHQKPVRFVNDIIDIQDDIAHTSCSFPTIPTLAMICEAAAQSSVVFSEDKEEKIGFLITLKDIELLNDVMSLDYKIKIKKEISLGSLNEFSFELIDDNKIYAIGNFVVKLEE